MNHILLNWTSVEINVWIKGWGAPWNQRIENLYLSFLRFFSTIKRLVEFDPVFEDEVAVVFAVPEACLSTKLCAAYVTSEGAGVCNNKVRKAPEIETLTSFRWLSLYMLERHSVLKKCLTHLITQLSIDISIENYSSVPQHVCSGQTHFSC